MAANTGHILTINAGNQQLRADDEILTKTNDQRYRRVARRNSLAALKAAIATRSAPSTSIQTHRIGTANDFKPYIARWEGGQRRMLISEFEP
ncbi:hypothetical protein Aduo_000388 [Ancylostoma duodenale]